MGPLDVSERLGVSRLHNRDCSLIVLLEVQGQVRPLEEHRPEIEGWSPERSDSVVRGYKLGFRGAMADTTLLLGLAG